MSSLDFQSIGRILEAVSAAGGVVPDDLLLPESDASSAAMAGKMKAVRRRRTELAIALSGAVSWSRINPNLTSDKLARSRFNKLADIGKAAEGLTTMIVEGVVPLRSTLANYFPSGTSSIDLGQVIDALGTLSKAAENERDRLRSVGLHDQAPLSGLDDGSTLLTAGEGYVFDLEIIFREFFKCEPTIRKDEDSNPFGPFIVFVQAAGVEQGNPTTAEAIEQARKRGRRRSGDKHKGK